MSLLCEMLFVIKHIKHSFEFLLLLLLHPLQLTAPIKESVHRLIPPAPAEHKNTNDRKSNQILDNDSGSCFML
jgi:hypothetical protein